MTKFIPVEIAYNEFTPVDGVDENDNLAPVIFLHGLAHSKEDWTIVPQTIANMTRRKTYAYDARNHGDSGFSDVLDFEITVDDLFHFMDNIIKAKKAVLVGHSMGGMTSLRAALREPQRVEVLFVEDMHTRQCPKDYYEYLVTFITLYVEGVNKVPKYYPQTDVHRFAIDYIASKQKPESDFHEEKEKLYKFNMLLNRKNDGGYDVKFNKDVILKIIRNPTSVIRDPSGKYEGPAYFVYAENSSFNVNEEEVEIKKLFPNAMLIEIKGASHNIHAEFPEEFIKVILKCLARTKRVS